MYKLIQGKRLGNFKGFSLFFLIFSGFCADGLTSQSRASDSQNPSFESFLQYPPVISKAVMELESFYPNQDSSKETLQFKFDGENYFIEEVETNAVAHGRFNGTFWQMEHRVNLLALYDPKMNEAGPWSAPGPNFEIGSDGKRKGPGFETEDIQFLTKREMNFLVNLGVPALDRSKEIIWDKSQSMVFAKIIQSSVVKPELRGGPCVIQLKYSNAVPVSAVVTLGALGSSNSPTYLIKYNYRPDTYAGQFPYEFSRFRDLQGKESSKEWTLRVISLEISNNHLAETDMDPNLVFKSSRLETHFWSNNIAYEALRSGKLRQVFGPKELAEQNRLRLEHRYGDRLHGVRIVLFLLFAMSGIGMAWFAVRKKTK